MGIVADSNMRMLGAPISAQTASEYNLQTRSSKHIRSLTHTKYVRIVTKGTKLSSIDLWPTLSKSKALAHLRG